MVIQVAGYVIHLSWEHGTARLCTAHGSVCALGHSSGLRHVALPSHLCFHALHNMLYTTIAGPVLHPCPHCLSAHTLPFTTIQQDSSSACFDTCRMLYSLSDAAPGPASTPPAVGACWAGCGAAAAPAGLTMKLLAGSEALLLPAGASCGWASAAAASRLAAEVENAEDGREDQRREWAVEEEAAQHADLRGSNTTGAGSEGGRREGSCTWSGRVTYLRQEASRAWPEPVGPRRAAARRESICALDQQLSQGPHYPGQLHEAAYVRGD